jgi:hypothetical protein
MNQFIQGLLNTVTGQQAPDFNFVLSLLVIYVLALWLAFCAWVFLDARRRYARWYVALFITLIVLVLNFPALILYLIVRPEDEEVGTFAARGGLEVPVVNFVDANGEVKLALNLQIYPNQNPKADMNISVGWDSERRDIAVKRSEPNTINHAEKDEKFSFGSWKDKALSKLKKSKQEKPHAKPVESVQMKSLDDSANKATEPATAAVDN